MSWSIGMFINGTICIVMAVLLALIKNKYLRNACLALIPLISAFLLYWGLVYIDGNTTQMNEYSSWSGLFIITWASSGYVALFVTVIVINQMRARDNS